MKTYISTKRQKIKCQNIAKIALSYLLYRVLLDPWFVINIMQIKLFHTFKCCSRYNFVSTRPSSDEPHIVIVTCHDDRWHSCHRPFSCVDIISSSQWRIGSINLNALTKVHHLVVINNSCNSRAIIGTEPENRMSKTLVHFV